MCAMKLIECETDHYAGTTPGGLMLGLEHSYKRHTAVFAGTQQYAMPRGFQRSAYVVLALRVLRVGRLPHSTGRCLASQQQQDQNSCRQ